jgi:hypothetical protein
MRRVVILLALVVPIALIARSRGRSNPDKIADVKGGIGSLEGDRQVLAQMRKGGAELRRVWWTES